VVSSEGYRLDGEPAGSGWTYPLPVPGAIADGHVAMLDHFVAALREDRLSDYEGEDGLALLAAVDAAQRSARTGALEAIDYSTKKESCA
jgi:predicted dehydrogenase